MMITGENIKQAIIQKLLEIEPAITVYKEASTSPIFPHFFVYQINVTDELERAKYHLLNYSFDIRYRRASDSSTDLKLQKNLDDMGLKLLQNFNIINFRNSKIKCLNKSIEKEDGVLHFFCNFTVLCREIDEESAEKFGKIKVEVKTE
nr:MAG TPA: tail completion protein [Caudoviricetes sp.]